MQIDEAIRLLAREPVEIEQTIVRVATPRMLYRMKRDTVRPQDRVDAAELKRRFALEED